MLSRIDVTRKESVVAQYQVTWKATAREIVRENIICIAFMVSLISNYKAYVVITLNPYTLICLTAVQNDLSRSKYTHNRNLHKKRNRTVCLSICSGWSSDLTALNRVVTRSNRGWKPPGWKEHRWFYKMKFLVLGSTTFWWCFIGVWIH